MTGRSYFVTVAYIVSKCKGRLKRPGSPSWKGYLTHQVRSLVLVSKPLVKYLHVPAGPDDSQGRDLGMSPASHVESL